jgi:hypothetical protein
MWIKIEDHQVRHEWDCPECHRKTTVCPSSYTYAQPPICAYCWIPMNYVQTEIENRTISLNDYFINYFIE